MCVCVCVCACVRACMFGGLSQLWVWQADGSVSGSRIQYRTPVGSSDTYTHMHTMMTGSLAGQDHNEVRKSSPVAPLQPLHSSFHSSFCFSPPFLHTPSPSSQQFCLFYCHNFFSLLLFISVSAHPPPPSDRCCLQITAACAGLIKPG